MRFFILVKVKKGKFDEVLGKLQEMESIHRVYPTFGGWDIVALGEFEDLQQLGDLMRKDILPLENIKEKNTLLEFKI